MAPNRTSLGSAVLPAEKGAPTGTVSGVVFLRGRFVCVDAHVVEYSKVLRGIFSREVRRPTARVLNTPNRARQERVATSLSPLDVYLRKHVRSVRV